MTTSFTTKVSFTTSPIYWIFYEEESPIYQYNDYEEDGIVNERWQRFATPSPNMRGVFPNPDRRNMFPNSIRDQGGGYSNLDEFSNSISSFDGSHDIESTLLWIEKIDNVFDMGYIPKENHVCGS